MLEAKLERGSEAYHGLLDAAEAFRSASDLLNRHGDAVDRNLAWQRGTYGLAQDGCLQTLTALFGKEGAQRVYDIALDSGENLRYSLEIADRESSDDDANVFADQCTGWL